jgi:ubiquinone/menaquinone biosynthesis C-methylase UbiE
MSSFVWMKFLESAPERYDRGLRLLSAGRIQEAYEAIADRVAAPGKRILDMGTGTGGVALACAARGAKVVAIDINAQMLEVARAKPVSSGTVEWLELGIAEIEDKLAESSFDAVVSCLLFSELSDDEQAYALQIARSRLVPGGALVIADETRPATPAARAWYQLRRFPLAALTYLLTQTSTQPVEHLAARIRNAGFGQLEERRLWGDTFLIVYAVREEAE